MTEGAANFDVDEAVAVLRALGVDSATAMDQLEAAQDDAERIQELVALAVESEAGLVLTPGDELDASLFEIVDALRQAGVVLTLAQTASAPCLVVGEGAGARAYEVSFEADAGALELVRALVAVLPETHHVLRAPSYDSGDALALVFVERVTHLRLRAAAGGAALEAALARVLPEPSPMKLTETALERRLVPDFSARFRARLPDAGGSAPIEPIWARVERHDARVAWPEGQRRPPGDDLFELTSALAGAPLARALSKGDNHELANVLYRFALVTTVGAHWDIVAARLNPGMSAQGMLGMGQLTWSWFVFAALGATTEAARAGRLLDNDWVRAQERGTISARQRAWFDFAAFLRTGMQLRPPALLRLRELLPLCERAGWDEPENVAAALALHTEPRGDQLTHQPQCHVWPAPLYTLMRRVSAPLPSGDAFLSRPLDAAMIDRAHPILRWCEQQLARFDARDEAQLPPLLDPLPVIVDVRVTEVDGRHAHGRTLLAAREDAEHHVVAPHDGRAMKPGEVWLFEVLGARQTRSRARIAELGEVSFQIALPTGRWLARVDTRSSPARI